MLKHTLRLPAAEGHMIEGTVWAAENPRCVIQLFHGLGEHHRRYERFAAFCTGNGVTVVAHDHRGHGSGSPHPGHFADNNGWQHLIDDALAVNRELRARFAGQPVILLGHSMGSYIATAYAMRHHGTIDMLILSASTWPERWQLFGGRVLARTLALLMGKRGKSLLLDKLGFAKFNKPFEPARTPLDWLSRDAAEVDAYAADSLCGGPFSCGLWIDLLGGLRGIARDAALSRIPADLPILLTGGTADPVGGEKGIARLAKHYATTGHHKLAVRLYEDGRHEMFNEINRDEFSANLLAWIEQQLPAVVQR